MQKLDLFYNSKSVLILGGFGFMGLNLARSLVDLGSQVTIADLSVSEEVIKATGIADQVETFTADISDQEAVDELIQGKDIIFSLAGKSGATGSLEDPLYDLSVNCGGQLTVLEACRRYNPEAVVVFPSSRLIYGSVEQIPVNEDGARKQPISIYAIHKLTCEMYYMLYRQIHDLRTVVLRISNPYGPWQLQVGGEYGVCNWFIYLATRGETIPIYGSGQQRRDYIYISDVVDAFLRCAATPHAYGQTFNVGSGLGTRLVDFANEVVEVVGRGKVEHVPWPDAANRIEAGDFVSDIAKLQRVVGWRPVSRPRKSIEETASFYRTIPNSLLRKDWYAKDS